MAEADDPKVPLLHTLLALDEANRFDSFLMPSALYAQPPYMPRHLINRLLYPPMRFREPPMKIIYL